MNDSMNDGLVLVLDPADEGMHDPGDVTNFNESAYLHCFDRATGVGGWFRIGNRPNEGRAEVSVCLYLPDGSVAFHFARPEISGNDAFDAGGLRIEVVEPFRRLAVRYDGTALLMADPSDMADPKRAHGVNPTVACGVELEITGIGPMWGGRQEHADGRPVEVDPATSFGTAHLEQHIAARGRLTVDGTGYEIDGLGLRDRSWGPRFWQAIAWYRFLPFAFGPDLSMMLLVQDQDAAAAGSRVGGMVLRDGAYSAVRECTIDTTWATDGRPSAIRAEVLAEDGRRYSVTGEILSTVPLRNRRTGPDGVARTTRILESQTRFRCGEHVGVGMAEYLDQMIDGRPAGPEFRSVDAHR